MEEQHSNFSFIIFEPLLPHGLRLVRYTASLEQAPRFRGLLLLYDSAFWLQWQLPIILLQQIAYPGKYISNFHLTITLFYQKFLQVCVLVCALILCLPLNPAVYYLIQNSLWSVFLTASFLAREHLKLFW